MSSCRRCGTKSAPMQFCVKCESKISLKESIGNDVIEMLDKTGSINIDEIKRRLTGYRKIHDGYDKMVEYEENVGIRTVKK